MALAEGEGAVEVEVEVEVGEAELEEAVDLIEEAEERRCLRPERLDLYRSEA